MMKNLTLQETEIGISSSDLAALSEWAGRQKQMAPLPDWKRAYALIREGADQLLRQRAKVTVDKI